MIVLVGLAGAAGALARWQLDAALTRVLPQAWRPLSILLINVLGSGLLGVLAGQSAPVPVVAGAGFLGAFTTFSTAFVEVLRLLLARRRAAAVLYGAATLALSVAAAAAGCALSGW